MSKQPKNAFHPGEILIEEFLKGEEMSYFIVTDGKTIKKFETANGTIQDMEAVEIPFNFGGPPAQA